MSRTYRYQEIAESLREAIAGGEYGDEGVLPSEAALSATHEASRVTIRKALEYLRDEGLIGSRQGFGWFVEGDPLRQSLDTLETIEDQLAAAGRTSERRVMAFRFRGAPPHVVSLLGDEVLEVIRLNLADEQPFALVTVWCAASIAAEFSRSDVERSTFVDLLGDRLGSAQQVISAVLAEADVAEALGVDEGSALLRVRRVTSDRSGANVLVSEHLYPAGQTEFEVTLHHAAGAPTGLRLVEDA